MAFDETAYRHTVIHLAQEWQRVCQYHGGLLQSGLTEEEVKRVTDPLKSFRLQTLEEFQANHLTSASLPKPEISTDEDGIEFTWRKNGKLVRLIAYASGQKSRIYSQVDAEPIMTRGKSIEASREELRIKFEWLLA